MRSRVIAWTLRVVLVVITVMVVWTGAVLLSVRGDLRAAQAGVEQIRASGSVASSLGPLSAAQQQLSRSVGRLRQPGPRLFAAVPLLGRSVAAVRRTAEAALAVTGGARSVLEVAQTGPPLVSGGRVDLARLEQVQHALEAAAASSDAPVRALERQPLGLVPSVVADPARTAARQLHSVPGDLDRAIAGLRALRPLLGAKRPTSVLVLLENNAELRATGGIVTVFADATAQDGVLTVRSFRDVEQVADSAADARTVAAPTDYVRLFGGFKANTTLWKNANMSTDVPTASQVLANIADASTGHRPDAMIWLDVPAIADVLRATGPARLPDGSTLSSENARKTLLSDAYRNAADTPEGQTQRRATLRAAADAVLGNLLGTGSPGSANDAPVRLARELLGAAAGRHVAVWSADPAVQADLTTAGLAGQVRADGGDLSSFAVHNLGGGDRDGNKLDYYGRRLVRIDVALGADSALVTQAVSVRNTSPANGLPVYVAGRATPGVSNLFITMAVPHGAPIESFDRDGSMLPARPLPAQDHAVLTDSVALSPGTTATWTLRYRLPLTDGHYALDLVPQPLTVDAGLSLTLHADEGLRLRSISGDVLDGLGRVALSGPFTDERTLNVEVVQPGALASAGASLRHFWSEPVQVP